MQRVSQVNQYCMNQQRSVDSTDSSRHDNSLKPIFAAAAVVGDSSVLVLNSVDHADYQNQATDKLLDGVPLEKNSRSAWLRPCLIVATLVLCALMITLFHFVKSMHYEHEEYTRLSNIANAYMNSNVLPKASVQACNGDKEELLLHHMFKYIKDREYHQKFSHELVPKPEGFWMKSRMENCYDGRGRRIRRVDPMVDDEYRDLLIEEIQAYWKR
eukprot:GHVH01006595.1.p1 GENE.GHVH01006595.1~~GHVH01006595.1.p1  ORF type:complete len:214 (+),score=19.53 GHVH01006595.1:70-711(+)